MIGWTPDTYDDPEDLPSNMPQNLKDHIKNESLIMDSDRPKKVSFSFKFDKQDLLF